ncbi:1,2-phenylacetyl-CoA epoxidase subunit A [Hazenella sp. IB182357]|uniref:1,2-phenylacetyl-CoA epoxidase subunit A n=1 Tax=Polycladospora coralii TaxID=2771432 RepID=A0A926NCV2_9BACL|nr:1,2-phenylacetyl-CoA epoxidase subunit PaaA [Polycladospora coralii]MBD1373040.1 1,2-phenylacetyl-CoA epoxidase subunit A [Polycladospora coralii]MBS7529615.1 1,2-phenylacetyl-CoA epoxidase subunit A [Polycladospora coralii]
MVFLIKEVTRLTEEKQYASFMERIRAGEKIEATDWMPIEYRKLLIKLIHMHAVSEIMGAYPEKEWVPRAPSLRRKLAIMAKVQDEMGHGQLLLRVVEDLSAPLGRTREELVSDIYHGKVKFHNVFHMEARTWADAGVIGWLVDGAAIINQASLLETSYGPYARVLKRICAEESFHMQHGENIILALAMGTDAQRQSLQTALDYWWESLLFFFGPQEVTPAAKQMMHYQIRLKTNEELRQKFLDKYVPRIQSLGLTIPDLSLRYDDSQKKWRYQAPDWHKFSQIVTQNKGPKSEERMLLRKKAHEDQQWVREAMRNHNISISSAL